MQEKASIQQSITHLSLLVNDYDDAIYFYVQKLGFDLLEDTALSPEKRWVLVRPQGSGTCAILLAKASTAEQQAFVGNQSGGRVFLFLQTNDFQRDYAAMVAQNITFVRPPSEEMYGTVAVFQDLYGNLWDLIQYKSNNHEK
jgi:catechol 2,3-dioxygenase-like lactoylglutathione lyase family enzyme